MNSNMQKAVRTQYQCWSHQTEVVEGPYNLVDIAAYQAKKVISLRQILMLKEAMFRTGQIKYLHIDKSTRKNDMPDGRSHK